MLKGNKSMYSIFVFKAIVCDVSARLSTIALGAGRAGAVDGTGSLHLGAGTDPPFDFRFCRPRPKKPALVPGFLWWEKVSTLEARDHSGSFLQRAEAS